MLLLICISRILFIKSNFTLIWQRKERLQKRQQRRRQNQRRSQKDNRCQKKESPQGDFFLLKIDCSYIIRPPADLKVNKE